MALRSEAAHEKGRKGVFDTKAWLESTTHLELNFDAYRFGQVCTVRCLDGSRQIFDLMGRVISRAVPLYVEVKTYDTRGRQDDDFDDFLTIAYSSTAALWDEGDAKAEFMWVTTHPFAVTKWPQLTSREQILAAIEKDDRKSKTEGKTNTLGGQPVNDTILSAVADRIWLFVLNKRQHDLVLTPRELALVESILLRKGAA